MTKSDYVSALNVTSVRYQVKAGDYSREVARSGIGKPKDWTPPPEHREARHIGDIIDEEIAALEKEPEGDFAQRYREFFEANGIEQNETNQ